MKKLILSLMLFGFAANADVLQDFDGLGANKDLLEQAKLVAPETNVRVVQERIVDRRNRFEIAPEFGAVLGGDAYTNTYNYGINVHWHFTPRWSLGLKYNRHGNRLSEEGRYIIQDQSVKDTGLIPDIDYAKNTYMAMIEFYPFYGKLSLYDLGVTHFDIYALAGYGQMELKKGTVATYTAGGGIGFWWSQHLSTRIEARWQRYPVRRFKGETNLDTTVASVQMGYLL